MSETQASPLLEREDFGDVTVLRLQVPMLRGDQTTDALFEHPADPRTADFISGRFG